MSCDSLTSTVECFLAVDTCIPLVFFEAHLSRFWPVLLENRLTQGCDVGRERETGTLQTGGTAQKVEHGEKLAR
jgi:hypothetical protein